MFARTERLLLRPGWAEDAPALARAIADEQVVRNLATAPWPYRAGGRRGVPRRAARSGHAELPDHRADRRRPASSSAPAASAGGRRARSSSATGSPAPHWGKGFATEAGRALIDIARTLKLPRLEASHFLDNPASGRVLEKLGFVATGLSAARYSCARGGEAMSRLYRLSLMGRGEMPASRWRPRLLVGARRTVPPRFGGRRSRARLDSAAIRWRSSSFHGWKPGRKNFAQALKIFRIMPGRTHMNQSRPSPGAWAR